MKMKKTPTTEPYVNPTEEYFKEVQRLFGEEYEQQPILAIRNLLKRTIYHESKNFGFFHMSGDSTISQIEMYEGAVRLLFEIEKFLSEVD